MKQDSKLGHYMYFTASAQCIKESTSFHDSETHVHLYIHSCVVGRMYFVEHSIHLIEEH